MFIQFLSRLLQWCGPLQQEFTKVAQPAVPQPVRPAVPQPVRPAVPQPVQPAVASLPAFQICPPENELDIEVLLRMTLELVVAKSGPTNAVIYLPTQSGDWSVGAYMNYDMPKEKVDMMLDRLADKVEPYFTSRSGAACMVEDQRLIDIIGENKVAFSCSAISCGEFMALLVLFRDNAFPFHSYLREQMKAIAPRFADQLMKIIRVHHRHSPPMKGARSGGPADKFPEL